MSDPPQSPSKEVEAGVQSPDDEAQMNDPQDPHSGLGYEFEVKEQDRWLPIANGERDSLLHPSPDLCALFVGIYVLLEATVSLTIAVGELLWALTGIASRSSRKWFILAQKFETTAHKHYPCRTIRRLSRRKRLAPHRKQKSLMCTMLIFATLHQSPGS